MGKIVFFCEQNELSRERKGYADAFLQLGHEVVCVPEINSINEHTIFTDPELIFILQPEISLTLPKDILQQPKPVFCFQIDTNDSTFLRIKTTTFFDAVFVFHPKFDQLFKKHGNPNTYFLPHAVDIKPFEEMGERPRIFDIGWVGRTDGGNYQFRREVLEVIQNKFKINELDRSYSFEELISIYKSSKMVVNLPKNNYLQDANLRCFEAMAAGALLFSPIPSELIEIGLKPDIHFVGFEDVSQLQRKLEYYLNNEGERLKIAKNGYNYTKTNHTYLIRAQQILHVSEANPQSKARSWSKNELYSKFCEYYSFRRSQKHAFFFFGQIDLFSTYRFFCSVYLVKFLVSDLKFRLLSTFMK